MSTYTNTNIHIYLNTNIVEASSAIIIRIDKHHKLIVIFCHMKAVICQNS